MQIPDEIIDFAGLAASRQPANICEIGCFHGGTSLFLSGLAPSVRRFIGLDREVRNHRLVATLAPQTVDITFLEGSSHDEKMKGQVVAALDGQRLDLLFIDGDHTYDGVLADFVGYRSLVRPGGLIAFHDIVPDHEQRYGSERRGWSGGVPRLWAELREQFPSWEFVSDQDQDGYGIGVLEHDPALEVAN